MRRADLERLGIQLPVLPTIVLGALPGPPGWAPRLERIGLDVVASGAAGDDAATWAAARAAVPHRPVKAVAADGPAIAALAAAGCRLVEGDGAGAPDGVYVIDPGDGVCAAVDGGTSEVEVADEVAARILEHVASAAPAAVWVAATPGLAALPDAAVEAKLTALVDGTRRARLLLAKNQFDM
ncbi:MAG: hypothetical protein AB1416_01780 [Actinomycetota bacterium]